MNKIEEAAKKQYGNISRVAVLAYIEGATHVQETELKEARELIEDLLAKLQRTKHNLSAYEESSVVSFLSSVNETITKAETFLKK